MRWRHPACLIAFACELLCLAASPKTAATPSIESEFSITFWAPGESLPDVGVIGMAQTPDGSLLCGSTEGLFEFDGGSFSSPGRNGIPIPAAGGTFQLACQENRGVRWYGGVGVIACERNGQWMHWGKTNELPFSRVEFIASGVDHRPYAVIGGAVWTIEGKVWEPGARWVRLPPPPVERPEVLHVVVDAQLMVWAAMPDAAARWADDRWTVVPNVNPSPVAISPSRDGGVWIANTDRLRKWRGGKIVVELGLPEPFGDQPGAVLEDRQGRVWVGADRGRIMLATGDGSTTGTIRASRAGAGVFTSLFEDRDGDIWAAAGIGGLVRFHHRTAHAFGPAQGLAAAQPSALLPTPDGSLFMGTLGRGVQVLQNDGNSAVFRPKSGDASPLFDDAARTSVRAMTSSGAARIWVAADRDVFAVNVDGSLGQRLPEAINGPVRALLRDHSGSLWAAGRNLAVLEEGQWRSVEQKEVEVAPDYFFALREESDGSIVALGRRSSGPTGVWRVVDRRLRPISDGPVVKDGVSAICTDADSTWFALRSGAMARWRRKRWALMDTSCGLPTLEVRSATFDRNHNLWLGLGHGVCMVTASSIAQWDSEPATLDVRYFDRVDGLDDPECLGELDTGATTDAAGRVWFATRSGVAMFDPARLPAKQSPPVPAFNSIFVDGRAFDLTSGSLDAPAGVQRIELGFGAACLGGASRLRYEIKLEPGDRDWKPAPRGQTFEWVQPNPGRYTLHLRTIDAVGIWPPATTEFRIAVPSLLSQKPWPAAGATLAIVIPACLAGRKWYLRRRRAVPVVDFEPAQQAAPTQAAAPDPADTAARRGFIENINHELRTPLSNVVGYADLLADTPLTSEQREFASAVRHSAQIITALVNDLHDFSLVQSGALKIETGPVDFREAMIEALETVAPSAAARGLDVAFDCTPGARPLADGDARRVRQILAHLLTNAIKLTIAGRIHASLTHSASGFVRCTISTSGFGIAGGGAGGSDADPARLKQHEIGLALAGGLAERMGGSVGFDGQTDWWFELRERASTDTAAVPASMPAAKGDVLLVDPAPAARTMVRIHLVEAGWRVIEAASGGDALAKLAGEAYADRTFNAVAFSSALTDMPAAELLRLTAEQRPGAGLRFVCLRRLEDKPLQFEQFPISTVARPVLRPAALLKALDAPILQALPDKVNVTMPKTPAPDGRRLALIVEDNEINMRVLTEMLRRIGWQSDHAANGVEGLRRACERRYDVILMDCHMPEMDGFEATRRIREAQPAATINGRTPIIAVTADARPESRRLCLECGMNDYISKPFRRVDLEELVKRWAAKGTEGPCAGAA
jgi:CheY-like chemotaxis protein/signal transduction histidine kinase/ligand-binding sensor domain-containing protein